MTFTTVSGGTYDPLTGQTTGATTVTVSGKAMQIDGDPDLYKALSLLETDNPTLLFVPDTAGQMPALGATASWGSQTYAVKHRKPLAMNGTPTAAQIVVSR